MNQEQVLMLLNKNVNEHTEKKLTLPTSRGHGHGLKH
jgi:hypothetical protein